MGVSVSRPIAFSGLRDGPINSCEMKLFFRMIHKSTSMGTCGDILTTDYWGVPLWAWILIVVALVAVVVGVRKATAKKEDPSKDSGSESADVEAANIKLPQSAPPSTPSPAPEYPRDAPLPPPAPSETSHKG